MTTFSFSKRSDVRRSPRGTVLADGYLCPECGVRTAVKDSRDHAVGIRRRRECPSGHRFTTYELTEAALAGMTDAVALRQIETILANAVLRVAALRRRSGMRSAPRENAA